MTAASEDYLMKTQNPTSTFSFEMSLLLLEEFHPFFFLIPAAQPSAQVSFTCQILDSDDFVALITKR